MYINQTFFKKFEFHKFSNYNNYINLRNYNNHLFDRSLYQ